MFLGNLRYWICQLIGWGGWTILYLLFTYEFAYTSNWQPAIVRDLFLFSIFIDFIFFIFFTHLFRYLLIKSNWMQFVRGKLILLCIIGSLALTGIHAWITQEVPIALNLSLRENKKSTLREEAVKMEQKLEMTGTNYYRVNQLGVGDSVKLKSFDKIKRQTGWYRNDSGEWRFNSKLFRSSVWWGMLITWLLLSLWLVIYILLHYIDRSRKDQLERLTLESTVKELELKTIKAHINPHFIFNSLNSIRALVDENPERARRAITELSNILRSSMHAEKLETVTLEKELDIVKDYLALEHMRFEDRLKIEYHIDEDTLDQQVPPMMLQTLVENAIKHGISKLVNGGVVKIFSDFVHNHYELKVQNTGKLVNGQPLDNGGFGLKSTQDRLKLLFGPNALFEIVELENEIVEAKVQLPIKINDQP
jgi:two-component system, LytTR family, sensor kinase